MHLDDVAVNFGDMQIVMAHQAFRGRTKRFVRRYAQTERGLTSPAGARNTPRSNSFSTPTHCLKDRVLFGSDYPLITPRALDDGLRGSRVQTRSDARHSQRATPSGCWDSTVDTASPPWERLAATPLWRSHPWSPWQAAPKAGKLVASGPALASRHERARLLRHPAPHHSGADGGYSADALAIAIVAGRRARQPAQSLTARCAARRSLQPSRRQASASSINFFAHTPPAPDAAREATCAALVLCPNLASSMQETSTLAPAPMPPLEGAGSDRPFKPPSSAFAPGRTGADPPGRQDSGRRRRRWRRRAGWPRAASMPSSRRAGGGWSSGMFLSDDLTAGPHASGAPDSRRRQAGDCGWRHADAEGGAAVRKLGDCRGGAGRYRLLCDDEATKRAAPQGAANREAEHNR